MNAETWVKREAAVSEDNPEPFSGAAQAPGVSALRHFLFRDLACAFRSEFHRRAELDIPVQF